MLMLLFGVVLFFLPHSVSIVAPHWRDRMVLHLGEGQWKGTYSVLVAGGLALLALGYADASRAPVVLYVAPAGLRYATFVLMLPVFPLLLATYLPGRILGKVRHPMLTAVQCWAAGHLMINGTLPEVVLFGSFLLWAAIDRLSLQRRVQSPIRRAPTSALNDAYAVMGGLVLYALFVWRLHGYITGVPLIAH